MHPVFLQPKQSRMAGQLSAMSNRSTPPSNAPELIILSGLFAKNGHLACLPGFRHPLICMLQAYCWPICLSHGSLPIQ